MKTAQRGIALRKTLIVLLIVCTTAAVGAFIFQKVTYEPEYRKAGDKFMRSLTTNDADASFALMTKALQDDKTKSGWAKEVTGSFADYTGRATYLETLKVTDPKKIYGDAGAYRVRYQFPYDNKTHNMDLIMQQENGSWKVGEFASYIL